MTWVIGVEAASPDDCSIDDRQFCRCIRWLAALAAVGQLNQDGWSIEIAVDVDGAETALLVTRILIDWLAQAGLVPDWPIVRLSVLDLDLRAARI